MITRFDSIGKRVWAVIAVTAKREIEVGEIRKRWRGYSFKPSGPEIGLEIMGAVVGFIAAREKMLAEL